MGMCTHDDAPLTRQQWEPPAGCSIEASRGDADANDRIFPGYTAMFATRAVFRESPPPFPSVKSLFQFTSVCKRDEWLPLYVFALAVR